MYCVRMTRDVFGIFCDSIIEEYYTTQKECNNMFKEENLFNRIYTKHINKYNRENITLKQGDNPDIVMYGCLYPLPRQTIYKVTPKRVYYTDIDYINKTDICIILE